MIKANFSFYVKHIYRVKFFSIILTLIIAFALAYSLAIGGGHIWRAHLRAGTLLLQGQIPDVPAYPMWGYSFLAAIFGTNLFFLQALITFFVLIFWYFSLVKKERQRHWDLLKDGGLALVLASWTFLAVSYYSNSVGQIFLFIGTWLIYLSIAKNGESRSLIKLLVGSFFIGLAVNIRTEYLLFAGLLLISLLLYNLSNHNLSFAIAQGVLFAATVFLLLVPWFLYTNTVVGKPLLTSTNGATVRYHGLGVLPNNPWNIISRDPFVKEIAEKELNNSPWSYEAHVFFSGAFLKAISDHPTAFVMRILTGWKLMLMQGLYTPDLRLWAAQSSEDAVLFDYAHELIKQKLGLHVNTIEMNQYREQGISQVDLTFRHYIILVAEYTLRLLFFLAFFGSLILVGFNLAQGNLHPFMVLICGSSAVYVLFLSGVVQANPRHTTLVLPFFVGAVLSAKSEGVSLTNLIKNWKQRFLASTP